MKAMKIIAPIIYFSLSGSRILATSTTGRKRTRRNESKARIEISDLVNADRLDAEFFQLEEDILLQFRGLQGMSMSMEMTPEPTGAPTGPAPTGAPTSPAPTGAPTSPAPTGAPTSPAPTSAPVDPMPTVSPTDAPVAPTVEPTPLSQNRDFRITEKCGVTPIERSRDILSILTEISVPVELIRPSTPEFRARDWLDNIDDAIICANDRERVAQRYRMALFYYNFGGPMWTNCRAWIDSDFNDYCLEEDLRNQRQLEEQLETEAVRFLDGSNECEWFGLSCGSYNSEVDNSPDSFFPITTIELKSNNLSGELPLELFGLTDLEELFLDGNLKIGGSIPTEVANLQLLRILDIDDNALSGTLPTEIYSMTELRSIDLNENRLIGTVSDDIGNLANLEVLQLENNLLTGTVPVDGLFQLLRLVALTIEGNMLTGTLEPLCEVRDSRRVENMFEVYLTFLFADCAMDPPEVECSCCQCF